MKHTVILVDDHPVFRQGIKYLLAKEKDLVVIGEADDGQTGIELVRKKLPNLVVMDINMPNLDGIGATRQILSESPETKVVALSVHSGKQFVRDMIHAGASGYILKESIPEEMIEGLRTVMAGSVFLSGSISKTLLADYRELISKSAFESDEMSLPILQTKLHRPAIASHVIPRVRLVETLEKDVQNPLTMIAAPAGYGKSILASQWLEVSQLPGAWLSLDEEDNDFRSFLLYFLEAIGNIFPEREQTTKILLEKGRAASLKAIAGCLLNELEALPERFILAVDNYQHIRNAEVHDLLAELLAHPSSNMHLALLTRRDPPLPLTSLRGRGMLTEIAAKDLRFTPGETKSFLERFLQMEVSERTVQHLEEKMEGWATGLHLAALSIRKEPNKQRLIDCLTEQTEYARDYLIQEVLSQISPRFARYILQSSILKRFCAPLCDALAADGSDENQKEKEATGADFIDWLMETHMFAVPADGAGRWFRFHGVFKELLLNQLNRRTSPEKISELHLRASRWFGENGLVREAFEHAMAGGDKTAAARFPEQNGNKISEADQEKFPALFSDAELSAIAHPSGGPSRRRQPLAEPLTNREIEVLHLLTQRLRNKEIADKLFITTETVKGHLKSIYRKLEAGNRVEAIAKAKVLKIF